MGTLTVLAPSFSTAGQTCGSTEGQALELLTWAPSTRYGAPSTSSAERPLRVTTSGTGAATATAANSIATRPKDCLRIELPCPCARPDSIEIHAILHFDLGMG